MQQVNHQILYGQIVFDIHGHELKHVDGVFSDSAVQHAIDAVQTFSNVPGIVDNFK